MKISSIFKGLPWAFIIKQTPRIIETIKTAKNPQGEGKEELQSILNKQSELIHRLTSDFEFLKMEIEYQRIKTNILVALNIITLTLLLVILFKK